MTARRLGVRSVAVYSEADAGLPFVAEADEAVLIGPAQPASSYLNAEAVLAAARQTGARAIHPGYGFLAENPAFAARVIAADLTWIGPSPAAMEQMGDKINARNLMEQAGVPVSAGTRQPVADAAAALAAADRIGYPVMIKASAGGGGIGMSAAAGPARSRPGSRPRGRGPSGSSAARTSCWSGTCSEPGTSKCRSSAWPTAGCWRWASVTARCSGGTRR